MLSPSSRAATDQALAEVRDSLDQLIDLASDYLADYPADLAVCAVSVQLLDRGMCHRHLTAMAAYAAVRLAQQGQTPLPMPADDWPLDGSDATRRPEIGEDTLAMLREASDGEQRPPTDLHITVTEARRLGETE